MPRRRKAAAKDVDVAPVKDIDVNVDVVSSDDDSSQSQSSNKENSQRVAQRVKGADASGRRRRGGGADGGDPDEGDVVEEVELEGGELRLYQKPTPNKVKTRKSVAKSNRRKSKGVAKPKAKKLRSPKPRAKKKRRRTSSVDESDENSDSDGENNGDGGSEAPDPDDLPVGVDDVPIDVEMKEDTPDGGGSARQRRRSTRHRSSKSSTEGATPNPEGEALPQSQSNFRMRGPQDSSSSSPASQGSNNASSQHTSERPNSQVSSSARNLPKSASANGEEDIPAGKREVVEDEDDDELDQRSRKRRRTSRDAEPSPNSPPSVSSRQRALRDPANSNSSASSSRTSKKRHAISKPGALDEPPPSPPLSSSSRRPGSALDPPPSPPMPPDSPPLPGVCASESPSQSQLRSQPRSRSQRHRRLPDRDDIPLPSYVPPLSQDNVEDDEKGDDVRAQVSSSSQAIDVEEASASSSSEFAESGIIISVTMENFMNQSYCEIQFNPNCTYIVGENGSGKSAVLSALMFCLGARATETGRGSSMKSFIRWNQSYAQVTVALKNEGDDAFEPDTFGAVVSVRRMIRSTGASSYQLLNEAGKIVSTRRVIIDKLLLHFNIQVTNPCVISTQDRTREFFHTTDASDLYKFFSSATELGPTFENLVAAREHYTSSRKVIVAAEEGLPKIRREADEAKRDYDAAADLETLEQQQKDLKAQMLWALVHEYRQSIEQAEKDIVTKEEYKQQLANKMDDYHGRCAQIETEEKDLKSQLQRLIGDGTECTTNLNGQNAKLRDHQRRSRDVDHRLQVTEQQIERWNTQITQAQARKEQVRQESSKDNNAEMKEISAELQDKFKELNEAKEHVARVRDAYNSAGDRKELDEQLARANQLADNEQNKLDSIRHRLRENGRAMDNALNNFGQHTVDILNAIEREQRFRHKPIGPIGKYVKLQQKEWAKAVEACLSPAILCAYAVDNHDDRKLLNGIFERLFGDAPARQRPYIIVQNFGHEPYQIPPNPFEAVLLSRVWDAISVDHPLVWNVIVDQTHCERYVLMEHAGGDGRDGGAYEFLHELRTQPDIARSLYGVYTKSADFVQDRHLCSISILNKSLNRSYLNVDFAREQRELKSKEQQCVDKLAMYHRDMDSLRESAQEAQTAKNRARQELTHAQRIVRDIEEAIQVIEDRQTEASSASGFDVKSIIEEIDMEITTCREEIAQAQSSVNELRTKHAEQKLRLDELKADRELFTTRATDLENEMTQARERLEELRGHHATGTRRLKNMNVRMVEVNREIQEKRQALEVQRGKMAEREALARDMHEEPITVREQARAIHARIKRLETEIVVHRERLGNDPEELRERMEITQRKKDDIEAKLRSLQTAARFYEDSLKERIDDHKRYRALLEKSLRTQFEFFLQRQKHSGQVVFNHEARSLSIKVGIQGGDYQKVTDLSGGERSYALLSFILSLQNMMDCPFRCMDEFDIFMDSVNRRVTMKLLGYATKKRDRQYIFLTPLDNSMLKPSKYLKIVKLERVAADQSRLEVASDGTVQVRR